MGDDDLFYEGGDPLQDLPETPKKRPRKVKGAHFGCSWDWVQRIRPVVHTRDQTIVAIYLWRRWVVLGERETFDVPNNELKLFGISRKTKYRTLELLEAAGLIRIVRRPVRAAPVIAILHKKPEG
jgi:hypothetical protein